MNKSVPLVVPEINFDTITTNTLISNPNCSTIQSVIPLKVLNDHYTLKRVVFSTYQAVSGAGINGLKDLAYTAHNLPNKKFAHPIYNNCLPHIDDFLENGYTKEEEKMINETRKILNLPNLHITATAVRVPVDNCHSISINVELEKEFNLEDIIKLLMNTPGIIVQNNFKNNEYPLATYVDSHNAVFVGRIRRDYSVNSGLNLWVVADNLRKGAATNAVQILQKLL